MEKMYNIIANVKGEIYLVLRASSKEEAITIARDSNNWIYDDINVGEILHASIKGDEGFTKFDVVVTEKKQINETKELRKEIKRLKTELKSEQYYTNKYIKRLHDAEEEINQLKKQLAEERAKQLEVDEPCPARTRQEYCDIPKGSCDGFPTCGKNAQENKRS